MPADEGQDTAELLERAQRGDTSAVQLLLQKNRSRLRRMIQVRIDPRVAARVDPSDIVQEAMIDASGRLSDFLAQRPLPFYPWLREIAYQRLLDQHRRHLGTAKRDVRREDAEMEIPDRSAAELAAQFFAEGTSPSQRLLKKELRIRMREALQRLDPPDREILVLRHLEQMRVSEIAAMLNISKGAVKMRRLRAIERLREFLDGTSEENKT